MDKKKKTYNQILLLYWVNILSFIVGFVILLYTITKDSHEKVIDIASSVVWERYAIILALIGIPAALKLYHIFYQKIKDLSQEQFITKYIQIYLLRMVILDSVVLVNVIGYYLFETQNFIYITIIAIFALMFSAPSKEHITRGE